MTPVIIAGCFGVLHWAQGSRGVIICGSLGDEALSIHRSQVLLAEHLAAAGFPTLRIDYYGTGDSDGEAGQFHDWLDSIAEAVRWLRTHCHVGPIALCGFRIGAALAAQAACGSEDIAALIMFAPVTTGRRFLREMVFAEQVNADIWKSQNTIDDGHWFEAHGLRIDHATREALEQLDIARLPLPKRLRVLLLAEPDASRSRSLAGRLREQGLVVAHQTIDGLDRVLRESHESDAPSVAFTRAAEWLGDAGSTNGHTVPLPCAAAILDLGFASETAVRLGPGETLVGILTVPKNRAKDAPAVLIANTGSNPRSGNARGHVTLARWLAEQGIVSLRMDGAGIGDAAPETGAHGQPYSEQGTQDVMVGADFLAAYYHVPIIVFGMCSGAYHAFHAALRDERINGLILVNLQKFVWCDGESLTVRQRTTFRTTRFYFRNILCADMWRRLASGRINVTGIAGVLACRALRQLAAVLDPVLTTMRGETRVGIVRRQVSTLAARSVEILYVLSGNDPGLDEVAEYFGLRGRRLSAHTNLTLHVLEKADHTLSAHWARKRLQHCIARYLHQRFRVIINGDPDVCCETAPTWRIVATSERSEATISSR
jgi:alpha-beta hydrolase superfamily lysophospholipase